MISFGNDLFGSFVVGRLTVFSKYGAYARDVIAAMLVYRHQKSWFVMVNQHGHYAIVIGIPWDWLHTLHTDLRTYQLKEEKTNN